MLHFEGKAYAWWLLKSFSLKNANTSTYAKFIEILVERFDDIPCETSSIATIKPPQTKLLHELGGSIYPSPFLKTNEEEVRLFDTFPRARYPLEEGLPSQKEDMKILSSKEDQDLRPLVEGKATSTSEEEEGEAGQDNAVIIRAPQTPHEEKDGALAPRKETLALLQRVPKDLTHRALGKTHEQHVPSLPSDGILKIREGKEGEWHHKMKSMYPFLFQSLK